MDKVQKILEDVERLCNAGLHNSTISKKNVLNTILAVVNDFKEKPVSEDLEEAAKEHRAHGNYGGDINLAMEDSFKLGANWKEQQMIEKAIDGYVIEDVKEGNGDFLLSADYLPKSMGLKDQQRVKVIVIKED